MEAEVKSKLSASKSERILERSGYRSGYRILRFDTKMGTSYLFVPKLPHSGHVQLKTYPVLWVNALNEKIGPAGKELGNPAGYRGR